jgi:glycosyltransferase involved in cell wall biosynthesis
LKKIMISLVVATLNRITDLDRLLFSLDEQSYQNFEVVVVDQNPDARLVPILHRHPGLAIRHLRSERGLSLSRNIGLGSIHGDIVAFPDDDCWYPKTLLAEVAAWFDSHEDPGFLITAVRDADGQPSSSRLPTTRRPCTRNNVWSCAMSTGLFMRRSLTNAVGPFDENMGVGAPTAYQSGEEIDYVLRALAIGFHGTCEPALTVHHPPLGSLDRLRRTTYSYALSTGRLQRIHRFAPQWLAWHLLRSFGGAVIRLCRGDLARSRLYVLRGAGQLAGYLSD